MSSQDTQPPMLVEPTARLEAEFGAMAREYVAAGEPRDTTPLDDFTAYVTRLHRSHAGHARPGRVPQSTYWLVGGDRILGVSRLRHRLLPHLELEGGHIGYEIRPTERRRGLGTCILALTLEKARERGLMRVLITCDDDNVGSWRIIEHNGGSTYTEATSERSGKRIRQYWIDLPR